VRRRFGTQAGDALRGARTVVCAQGGDHLIGQCGVARIEEEVKLLGAHVAAPL
jgi:hypothetical protein